MFLFDESVETFRLRARGQGLDIGPHLETGALQLTRVDPAECSPGEFAHGLRLLVDEGGVRFVAIDSLNGYLHAMPDEAFMNLHVHDLMNYLVARGVITLVTMTQPGPLTTGERMSLDISYLADTVILLDIGLPDMDGFEVAQRLRDMPILHDVRLIGMSGFGTDEHRRRSRVSGMDHFLTKPVTAADLAEAVASGG